jgi:AraC family transcriptional regulator
MTPRILQTPEKKLIGMHQTMSLLENKTGELWSRFMPRRKEIEHLCSTDLISLQVYSPNHFVDFNPSKAFQKWAAVEVELYNVVPDGMETLIVPGGLCAVFDYTGSSSDTSIFQYIFGTWLPNSAYELDQRPHFEVLGEKYKNNDASSEEEIWIPIRMI